MQQKLGEVLEFEGKFLNVMSGTLDNATVTVNVYNPARTLVVSSGAATFDAAGRYWYNYTSDMVGKWKADFATTNVNADVFSVSDIKYVVTVDYFGGDISSLATQASVDALGSPMQASSYVAPDNATVTLIDGKIDTLTEDVAGVDEKADEILEDIYYLTHNPAGDPIVRVIPQPAAANYCILYESVTSSTTKLPPTTVTASAQITNLPYNYDGQLFTGETITGTYASGVVSWELPYGATVMVSIKELGIFAELTVPADIQARIYDLLTGA